MRFSLFKLLIGVALICGVIRMLYPPESVCELDVSLAPAAPGLSLLEANAHYTTQIDLLQSPFIITKSVGGLPESVMVSLVGHDRDPVQWIQQRLSVTEIGDFGTGKTARIRISSRHIEREKLAKVLQAISDAYLATVNEVSRQTKSPKTYRIRSGGVEQTATQFYVSFRATSRSF